MKALYHAIRTDIRRWLNSRKRSKRVVYTWDRWDHTRAVQDSRRRLLHP